MLLLKNLRNRQGFLASKKEILMKRSFSLPIVSVRAVIRGVRYLALPRCKDIERGFLIMVIGAVFGRVVLLGRRGGSDVNKGVLVYFIFQLVGSRLILVGLRVLADPVGRYFCSVGYLVKVGLFPFHWWVYYVFPKLG